MASGTESAQRSLNGTAGDVRFHGTPDVDRIAAIWRRKFQILLAGVVLAAVTFGVCHVVPKTFEASAIVRISLPPPSQAQISSQSVTAASDLAGQYSQLATLHPVLSSAAKRLGTTESVLGSSVSAGTVSGQNLISVRGQARTSNASRAARQCRRGRPRRGREQGQRSPGFYVPEGHPAPARTARCADQRRAVALGPRGDYLARS